MIDDLPHRQKVRTPIVEGIFYPASREELVEKLDGLFSACPVEPGDAFAIVSPHAGFEYSWAHSTCAFRAASNRSVSTVVILAPVHRDPTDGIILPESTVFHTPMGDVMVDLDALEGVRDCGTAIYVNDIPHLEEHCIEVQLPFIQRVFPDAKILPVLMGGNGAADVKLAAGALQSVFGERYDGTLFVVSANFSGFTRKDKAGASAGAMQSLLSQRDWKGLLAAWDRKEISSCGVGCIASLLAFDVDYARIEILSSGDSARGNALQDSTVEYASVAFWRRE